MPAQRFQTELLGSILLKVLEDANDPVLTREALSPKPNIHRVIELLTAHNMKKHAQLVSGQSAAPAKAAPGRARSNGNAPIVGDVATRAAANLFRSQG